MAVSLATPFDGVADAPLLQQTSLPSPGAVGLAPFVAPVLVGTRTARAIALLARVAMAAWAYAIGVIGIRWDGDRAGVHRTVTVMTVAGIAIVVAWFASAVYWSVVRTRNVHRLEGRFPTVGRAVPVVGVPTGLDRPDDRDVGAVRTSSRTSMCARW